EKNSDPASEAAMHASPHMLTACADTSRENGDGARKRGSVVAILVGEGTAASALILGARAPTARHPEPVREHSVSPGTVLATHRYDGSVADGILGRPNPWGADPAPTGPADSAADDASITRDPGRFLNRELSWLDFNARVLALAEDPKMPLLERAKFLAIFAQNLDEYFQVRVSGLQEQFDAGIRTRSPDGLDSGEQLRAVRDYADELGVRHAATFAKDIAPALEDADIRFASWED